MKPARTSLALLVIQLALVTSIGAKYLYQRSHCPRVWTRATMYDPELIMRGRYLSMQLQVDGCQSTLPSAAQARYPRNLEGVPQGNTFSITGQEYVQFPAKLVVKNNKLVAIRIPDGEDLARGQYVFAPLGQSCDAMRLSEPVNFYLAEHATSPLPVQPGQELWVEVTVPPKGPPRPNQLALKDHGAWKPLAFQ
jgi:hypothetical protein